MRNAYGRLSARIIGTIPYYSGQREATWQSNGGGMGQPRQCCTASALCRGALSRRSFLRQIFQPSQVLKAVENTALEVVEAGFS